MTRIDDQFDFVRLPESIKNECWQIVRQRVGHDHRITFSELVAAYFEMQEELESRECDL